MTEWEKEIYHSLITKSDKINSILALNLVGIIKSEIKKFGDEIKKEAFDQCLFYLKNFIDNLMGERGIE